MNTGDVMVWVTLACVSLAALSHAANQGLTFYYQVESTVLRWRAMRDQRNYANKLGLASKYSDEHFPIERYQTHSGGLAGAGQASQSSEGSKNRG